MQTNEGSTFEYSKNQDYTVEDQFINNTHHYSMFEPSPSSALLEEARQHLLDSGISEQSYDDLIRVAQSYDKLKRLNYSLSDAYRLDDRKLTSFFDEKARESFEVLKEPSSTTQMELEIF